MLDGILSTIQGFLSRAFWFGSFLPVAVVAALHLLIAAIAFPAFGLFDLLKQGISEEPLGFFGVAIAALIVLAYIMSTFGQLARGFLDGRYMPDWLANKLYYDRMYLLQHSLFARRPSHRQRRAQRDDVIDSHFEEYYNLYESVDSLIKTLEGNRDRAENNHKEDAPERESDVAPKELTKRLSDSLNYLCDRLYIDGRPEKILYVREFFYSLRSALERYPLSDDLLNILYNLLDLVHDCESTYDYKRKRMWDKFWLPRLKAGPTRFADARSSTQQYSWEAYHVYFNFIWPRIQSLMPEDGQLTTRIRDADTLVSFTTLSLFLTATLYVWLPVLYYFNSVWWLFTAVGLLVPLFSWVLYHAAVQSQLLLGVAIRSAIDMYRIQVLTDVAHQVHPGSLMAERALWEQVEQSISGDTDTDLSLYPPKVG